MDINVQNLGHNIKLLRKDMGLSCGHLAKIVGVSITNITNIEQGVTPSPRSTLVKGLCRVFGVSLSDLENAKMETIDKRKQAITRMNDIFMDEDWATIFDNVDARVLRYCNDGRFL